MSFNSRTARPAVDSPPLGFVAVLSPNADGAAKETLQAILPDLADGPYHRRVIPGMAMAVRDDNISIGLTSGDQCDVVLLGDLVSECVGPGEALSWAVSALSDGRYAQLSMCQGVFVLITLDWTRQIIKIAGDLLGIKPLYVAARNGVTILSDHAEAVVRLGGAQVDPLGLAGWFHFGAPLVNRTMFASVERIPPATVVEFDRRGRRDSCFWTPRIAEEPISTEDLMDGVYDDFAKSVSRLLAPYDSATSLLSGGFDSRLCLLTALRESKVPIDAVTTPCDDAERQVAAQVAAMSGVQCRVVTIKRAWWDEFDDMWFIHPDGFPSTKIMSDLCLAQFGGVGPFIDGSISAVAIRCKTGNPKDGPPPNEAVAREFVWKVHAQESSHTYFRRSAGDRLEGLGRRAADEQSDVIGWNSKFCLLWDMFTDERRHNSLNFLHYAHLAKSVQPFYDRALIERHLQYPQALSSHEFYRALLREKFPGAGGLPHNSDLPIGRQRLYEFSHALWREMPALIGFVHRHRDVLNTQWLLPRLSSYALGWRKYMYVVLALTRLLRLEEELNHCGVELDFDRLLSQLDG
jgi:hypothetical protein